MLLEKGYGWEAFKENINILILLTGFFPAEAIENHDSRFTENLLKSFAPTVQPSIKSTKKVSFFKH